jgi:hypothetical protein
MYCYSLTAFVVICLMTASSGALLGFLTCSLFAAGAAADRREESDR